MKFGRVPLDLAEGAYLAHAAHVGGRRIVKGKRLDAADIADARAAGLDELVVATLESGDLHEDAAAALLASAAAGPGLSAHPPVHGRANIVADAAGLLLVETAAIDIVNAHDEAVTLGTLAPFAPAAKSEIVATVKIIPFAAPEALVRSASASAKSVLRLAPFGTLRVAFIQTTLPGTSAKLLAKTAEVTQARCAALGLAAWREMRCAHTEEALAAVLAETADADIVLVSGASAISDRRDVIPAAIEQAGGGVLRLGMPVDPGNLLCLARIGTRPVIGLPGCARSPRRNGFDWVLERLWAGLDVSGDDIARMGAGGLLADVPRPEPRPKPAVGGSIGAVVLAAGRSVRMGANKLLADLGGRPVLAHVLDAVKEAGLSAIVVTGNAEAEIAALAGHYGFPSVHAARYAEGLSQSLTAGIAAVPEDWSAALVLLGDMPEVSAGHIASLAAAADANRIAVPAHKGKRGNPVAWGRRYFARLRGLEGDVGGKALLAEFADDIVEVPVESDAIFMDVDTPEALAAARARYS
ncbi:molybdopterin-binding/glycosyltransferase family 2 protein [Sphingosinicella sp.]|uniref:molybdopterin-binding/glycosyltransferase family 2 protein n=1 Tax=Sphingosinicella sp. TaxID=1917971 RepID=UPI00261BE73E|nr:molybdopterin-binding/glycosyltransferase family 2 protein [Sphingosinicella sp.]